MEPIEGVYFLQGDFREPEMLASLMDQIGGRAVDVVVSDMAPNLSGIAATDASRMIHLIELALEFCQANLKRNGVLVAKVFHGAGYEQAVEIFKSCFRQVKSFKPKASRAKSAENFLIGVGLK